MSLKFVEAVKTNKIRSKPDPSSYNYVNKLINATINYYNSYCENCRTTDSKTNTKG